MASGIRTLAPVPTAAEYRDAARRYRTLAAQLFREAVGVGTWPVGFAGDGIVRDAVDAAFDRTARRLRAAGDEILRIARVCDARADVCQQYADAVRRHHERSLIEQLWHGDPVRPESWVEP